MRVKEGNAPFSSEGMAAISPRRSLDMPWIEPREERETAKSS
jgi:hypothetical protein